MARKWLTLSLVRGNQNVVVGGLVTERLLPADCDAVAFLVGVGRSGDDEDISFVDSHLGLD